MPSMLFRVVCFLALSNAERDSMRDDVYKSGHDACFANRECVRLVVGVNEAGGLLVRTLANDQVQIGFSHCAKSNEKRGREEPLPQRFAYGEPPAFLTFAKQKSGMLDNIWVATDGQYMKTIYAVKVNTAALHGAHRFKDVYQPALQDPQLDDLATNAILTSSSEKYGKKTADQLVQVLADAMQHGGVENHEAIQIIIDIKKQKSETNAVCPPLGPSGNHAFSSSDHFKLMVFGSAQGCNDFEKVSPPGTEKYCISPDGKAFNGDLRVWAVAVDLRKAQPLVRNPNLEDNGGLSYKSMPPEILNLQVSDGKSVKHELKKAGPSRTRCKYVSYSPEQYLNKTGQKSRVKVMLNANFFGFINVQELPCGNPIGPVVADGQVVQTLQGSEEIILTSGNVADKSFERLKASHVLVMVRQQAAFVLNQDQFERWFAEHTDLHPDVNAITGQRVLENGRRIDLYRELDGVQEGRFWSGKNARTVVGLQHRSDPCPPEWGLAPQIQCSNMLVLLQFEKQSTGSIVFTFFGDEAMSQNERVPSKGANMYEVQDVLQFLMMDEAINFDGSGSSSLWTSIGEERRSQPSDWLQKQRGVQSYAFRPSPIVFGFGDLP